MTTSPSPELPVAAASSGGRMAEPRAARDGFVRDRQHRFPGRKNALKVLYDDVEVAAVRSAAEVAGLTPTGFVAAAGVALAGAALPPALSADRQLRTSASRHEWMAGSAQPRRLLRQSGSLLVTASHR